MSSSRKIAKFTIIDDSRLPHKIICRNKCLPVLPSDHPIQVVLDIIRKSTSNSDIDQSVISKVELHDFDCTDVLDFTFQQLCGSFEGGIGLFKSTFSVHIKLPESSTIPDRARVNAFEIMTQRAACVLYLDHSPFIFPYLSHHKNIVHIIREEHTILVHTLQEGYNVQDQVKNLLQSFFYQIGFGYRDDAEKTNITSIISTVSSTLCFIQDFLKPLMR